MEKIKQKQDVIIIGAGLAGLTAAIRLAEKDISSLLVSCQPSERAQSVLAEGGINGALDTMGEGDLPEYHKADTLKAGCFLADPQAVEGLAFHAPEVIRWLDSLGVPFYRKNGVIWQRNFGGQKKKRTAYAQSSTGKVIMSALIDEARKYEADGRIHRYPHHEMKELWIENSVCRGVLIEDLYTKHREWVSGVVLLAYGGMNGCFPGKTTGTTVNSGAAAAAVFSQGAAFSNLEMIQYHPTTIGISGKRCLVSEAARGEGGRLFAWRNTAQGKSRWYFMEEKYPELGNLMPRDVVAREMYFVCQDPDCGGQVYLDLTGLSKEIWKNKLADLRQELQYYYSLDPVKTPVPVEPGIHYFMGGIDVDVQHRTSLKHLYAAGECCSQYHGANRLGGNSILGAVYGGQTAAAGIYNEITQKEADIETTLFREVDETETIESRPLFIVKIRDILMDALGIVRREETLRMAAEKLEALKSEAQGQEEENRLRLAMAMVESARNRKESRGAHYREDYPKTDERYEGRTLARWTQGKLEVTCVRTR